MAFGIDQLTNDQLLELLQEACVELGNRDPIIRDMAQTIVVDAAETAKVRRDAAKEAVRDAAWRLKAELVRSVRKDVDADFRSAVAAGEVALLSVEEEGDYAALGSLEAQLKLLTEEIARIEKATGDGATPTLMDGDFLMRVNANAVTIQFQKVRTQFRRPTSQACADILRYVTERITV